MRRTLLVLALVVAAACSDDEPEEATPTTAQADDATTSTEATTTSTAPATEAAPAERYPDHAGELYAGTTNWICHPELADDVCRDLRTTVVAPDGSTTVDELAPAADPSFDCFYVYPTTSTDPETNSDLSPDSSEIDTVRAQAARYASVCRVFAPVYRSITLNALGRGDFREEAGAIAYGDVVDAWRTYVDELGEGRPVVVIGHSQGSGHLTRLLREEIGPDDGVRPLLASAVLLGSSVAEGSIPNIDACADADDTGCIVSYSSYPADQPPVEGALFGRPRDGSGTAVCVDPDALDGEPDDRTGVVLPTQGALLGAVGGLTEGYDTPFVSLPDAVRTSCETAGPYHYLAVGLLGEEDTRPLEGIVAQRLGPTWGLHLVDANVGQDDLIELVSTQAEAHDAG